MEMLKVKIIENEHICKNFVSHIWSGVFLVNFEQIIYVLLFLLFWTGKYQLARLREKEDLCHFHINSFSSSPQTFSIQSGVFLWISIFRGYYAPKYLL